jgi:hypothetical protein
VTPTPKKVKLRRPSAPPRPEQERFGLELEELEVELPPEEADDGR